MSNETKNQDIDFLIGFFKKTLELECIEKEFKINDEFVVSILFKHEKTLIACKYKSGEKQIEKSLNNLINSKTNVEKYLLKQYNKTKNSFNKVKYIFIVRNVSKEKKVLLNSVLSKKKIGKDQILVLDTKLIHDYEKLSKAIDKKIC